MRRSPRSHVLDVYGAHLHLATNAAQWRALARRIEFVDSEVPESAGLTQLAVFHPKGVGLPTPHLVFWIDLAAHDDADLVDTCAHEASHGVGALMEHIGHRAAGIDEPSAYLAGWLTTWIWHACRQDRRNT